MAKKPTKGKSSKRPANAKSKPPPKPPPQTLSGKPRKPRLRSGVKDQVQALQDGKTEWGIEYEQFANMGSYPPGYSYQLYHVYIASKTIDGSPPGGRGTIYTRRDGFFNDPEDVIDYMESDDFQEEIDDEGNYYVTSIVYVIPKSGAIVPGAKGRYTSNES